MDNYSCHDCGKGIKSLSSLLYYRIKCPVLLGQRKIVVPKIYRHSSASQSSIESTKDSPKSQISHVLQLPSCKPQENSELKYKDWININNDTNSSYISVLQTQSRLLITTSARIESYKEVTDKSAGEVLDDSEHIHHESRTQKPKAQSAQILTYYLFRIETDFAAAQ